MAPTEAATIDSLPVNGYPQSMIEPHEQALLERIRNGDEQAFELLVKQHTGQVLGLARRLIGHNEDAEDLAQEAFLRLHRSLPTFRGESLIRTWLYRTTTRLAIDYLRRERLKRRIFFFRQSNEELDPVDLADDPTTDPGRLARSRESMVLLKRALLKLSPRQRVIFTLRHYEGLSLNEISEQLELKVGTIKAHLHRAVSQLRLELAEYREETL